MISVTKPINLAQLQAEMVSASIDVGAGLGMTDATIYRNVGGTPGVGGEPADAAAFADETAAQTVVDAHVAMRDKTDAEYSVEFQDAGTTAARKQEIRDITAGLLPREQVPM